MAGPFGAITSTVYITGTATALTGACDSVSSKVYHVTDATQKVLDPDTAIVVSDGGGVVAATAYTIDYMFGVITFDNAPSGTVTIAGKYLPLWAVATARGYEINDETELPDTTVFHATETCQQCMPTTRDCSGSLTRLDAGEIDYDTGGGSVKLRDLLIAATPKVLSITFGSSALTWRGMVFFDSDSIKIDVKGVIEGTINWSVCRSTAATIDSGSVCAWGYSED